MLKKILENGRGFAVIISLTLFVSSLTLAVYNIYLLVIMLIRIVKNINQIDSTYAVTGFITLMDINLVAIVLYIFSVGVYELFVGELNIPAWLKVKTLEELKAKLAGIMILILVIDFAKYLVEWKNPLDTLYFALSVALVSAVLIFYKMSIVIAQNKTG